MLKSFLKDTFSLIAGSILFSVAINIFALPNSLVTGGAGGLAIIINSITGLAVGTGILIINTPLFISAYFICGKAYALKTILSTTVFSVIIDITEVFIKAQYTKSLFIASLVCGILTGISLYILLKRALVTGGSDLLAYLINKKNPKRAVALVIFIIDAAVVVAGAFLYKSIQKTIFSVFLIGVMSVTLSFLLEKKINGKLFKRNNKS